MAWPPGSQLNEFKLISIPIFNKGLPQSPWESYIHVLVQGTYNMIYTCLLSNPPALQQMGWAAVY